VLFNFLGFLWPVSILLISTRFFVDQLGSARYGTWIVANAFISLAAFAQFGLNDATTFYVAKHVAAGRRDEAARAVGTTISVYLVIGVIVSAFLWFTAPSLVGTFMGRHLDQAGRVEAVALLRILVWAFPLSLVHGGLKAAAAGLQLYQISMATEMVRITLWASIAIGCVWAGMGMVPLAVAALCAFVTAVLMGRSWLARVGLPVWPRATRRSLKEMMHYGGWTWISSIGALCFGVLDRLLLGALLGREAVTYYAVPQSLAQRVHHLTQTLSHVLFPAIGAVQDDKEKLTALYTKGHTAVLLIVGSMVSGGILAGPAILELWMGADFASQAAPVFQWLIITVGLYACSIVPYYTLLGVGKPKPVAASVSLGGVLFLGVALLVVRPPLGPEAVAMCSLAFASGNIMHLFSAPSRQALLQTAATSLLALCLVLLGITVGWLIVSRSGPLGSILAGLLAGTSAGLVFATLFFLAMRKRPQWPLYQSPDDSRPCPVP
jgi:O-antigen/teichoic acid export membrane protein